MEHFERFDADNDEFPSQKYPQQAWYGKKEIPNVLLTVYDKMWDATEKHEIYFDILTQYYEEYDSEYGWKIVIELPLMSPKVYELLTQRWSKYSLRADNFWRSQKTGKDEGFIEPEHIFNRFKIEHKLQCDGNPTQWYMTFWKETDISERKAPAKLKEVDL